MDLFYFYVEKLVEPKVRTQKIRIFREIEFFPKFRSFRLLEEIPVVCKYKLN